MTLTKCYNPYCFLLALICFSCSTTQATLEDFAIFEGNWKLSDTTQKYDEHWRIKNERLEGSAVETQAGDTVFYEEMEIFYRGSDGWVLAVSVKSENNSSTVFFILEDFHEGHFQFVNDAHDFPKRITYTFPDDAQMHAAIDDAPDGNQRMEFDFVKN